MTYVITDTCVGTKDESCIEVCPVDCIYDIGRMRVIHPDECIDCGACLPVCPVEAIFPDNELPESESRFLEVNAAIADTPERALALLDAQP